MKKDLINKVSSLGARSGNRGSRTNKETIFITAGSRNHVRDDKSRTSAFTLIELLVVVLIIGILSAIALPQYSAAVLKARVNNITVLVRAIVNAEEVYYLANGEYTTADKLDVSLPNGSYLSDGRWVIPGGGRIHIAVYGTVSGTVNYDADQGSIIIQYWLEHGKYSSERTGFYCYARATDELAMKMCKNLSDPTTEHGSTCSGFTGEAVACRGFKMR